MMTKELILFQIYLIYVERSLEDFPTRMSKVTQKSVCLYANFSMKGCLDLSGDISPYKFELFKKGEFMDSVDP